MTHTATHRPASNERHHASILVAGALSVFTLGCGTGPLNPEPSAPVAIESSILPPEGSDLLAITLPDYALMTEPVVEQMRTQESALRARIDDPSSLPIDLGDAYGRLGMLFLAAAEVDAAETSLRNAETLIPRDVRWPYYLGRVHESNGGLEESARAYERAGQLRPNDLAIQVLLGNVLLAGGHSAAAEETFRGALALDPDAAAPHVGLGQVSLAAQDHTRAAEHLEHALTLAPGATSIHYPLALAYQGMGDATQAAAHLRARGDVETYTPDVLRQQLDELLESANAYNIRGGRALDSGDYVGAADFFRQGLELDQTDPSLRQRLGVALFQLGRLEEAQQQFEQVVDAAPEHTPAQFSLGLLLADQGRTEAAIERFGAALEYDPEYTLARLQLAGLLSRTGRANEALDHYDHVLAADPTRAEPAFGAAMALVRLGQFQSAVERLEESVQIHPDDTGFTHALARILAAAPDDGVRDGERAMSLVETLLAEQQNIELGETAAMALAELGLFRQAAAVQRDIMTAAEQSDRADATARIQKNLALYEQERPSRTPFTEEELP